MARIEGIAKLLYYPTPPGVVALIGQHLVSPVGTGKKPPRAGTRRMLDPCAGTGAALAELGRRHRGETYGIELSEERASAARSVLDHLLHGSAFSVRMTNGAFSLLLLNAPYDDDSERRRLEHHFLTTYTPRLVPGGVLVYIVPQRRLKVSAAYLSHHYEDLDLYRFPDPHYERFAQVVLFGRRRSLVQRDTPAEAFLEQIADQGPHALDPLTEQAETVYDLPVLPQAAILFASQHFDAGQAEAEAEKHGLLARGLLADRLWPPEEERPRPLLPLKRTHVALLTASGLMDNVVLDNGCRRVLVKGRTYKEMVRVESEDPRHQVHREMVRTTITLLDLDTSSVEQVDHSGTAADDNGKATP